MQGQFWHECSSSVGILMQEKQYGHRHDSSGAQYFLNGTMGTPRDLTLLANHPPVQYSPTLERYGG